MGTTNNKSGVGESPASLTLISATLSFWILGHHYDSLLGKVEWGSRDIQSNTTLRSFTVMPWDNGGAITECIPGTHWECLATPWLEKLVETRGIGTITGIPYVGTNNSAPGRDSNTLTFICSLFFTLSQLRCPSKYLHTRTMFNCAYPHVYIHR